MYDISESELGQYFPTKWDVDWTPPSVGPVDEATTYLVIDILLRFLNHKSL